MEPPPYEEASLHPPALSTEGVNIPPPPSYNASLSSPSTPPPTYGEAVGVTPPVSGRQTQPAVVVTQPLPVPISVTCLRDIPGLVRCPHCHHTVTTKVTYLPGRAAWCMCVLLTLMGLVCGFCLIPLMVRGLQDAHHSCPQCGNHLHIHTR
ncbi:lipopolysaccharide-induced tumor necrosis factor-alpha factor homolog isoform X2 [Toxotes jaculatrix]|uniref:lipopolysaccharide-induced tumor necrosis factor-alpha factor homolog isoform X2 n=1 Tax=Toxotes jaculatrix TaxID=941984 RepID=UPI001B3A9C08|nr:lipopolysaccharide-induced tumor necrosis factor-alpha factor homolog isoform X2 [Toxotes jaculatrix]